MAKKEPQIPVWNQPFPPPGKKFPEHMELFKEALAEFMEDWGATIYQEGQTWIAYNVNNVQDDWKCHILASFNVFKLEDADD